MTTISKEYIQFIEVLANIFIIDKGSLKILLLKKKIEPYKGYWCLPSSLLKNNETINESVNKCIYEKTGITSIYVRQNDTISDINRVEDSRLLGISFIGLTDNITLLLHQEQRDYELKWFDLNNLPKLAFDHNEIVLKSMEFLKYHLIDISMLKHLFPADFTLPELQRLYEQLLNIKIDRRNFRKKFLNLNLIEDTNDLSTGISGRPAKLYRFKDDIECKKIF